MVILTQFISQVHRFQLSSCFLLFFLWSTKRFGSRFRYMIFGRFMNTWRCTWFVWSSLVSLIWFSWILWQVGSMWGGRFVGSIASTWPMACVRVEWPHGLIIIQTVLAVHITVNWKSVLLIYGVIIFRVILRVSIWRVLLWVKIYWYNWSW